MSNTPSVRTLAEGEPDHVAWCRTVEGLEALRAPDITMAILPRRPNPMVAAYLERRDVADFRCLRLDLPVRGAEATLTTSFDGMGLPAAFGRRAWAADITRLAGVFAAVVGTSWVRLRLERVENDACRLFHPDHVAARLVCTYHGPATQWLPEDAADRTGIGGGDNDRICRDWSRVSALEPFWVGLMKGQTWPGHAGGGLLHRSPPLSEGQWRMFMALDPV